MELSVIARERRAAPTSPVGARSALVILGSIGTAVGGGFVASRVDLGRDALVLSAIGAVLLAPIVIRIAQRRFDPFEPIVIYALAFGAMFLIRPLAILADGELIYERAGRIISVSETFSEMIVLAAAGSAAFIGAYALPVGRKVAGAFKVPSTSFDGGGLLVGAVVTAAAGLVLTGLFLLRGGISLELILAGRSSRLTEAYRSSSAYLAHGPYLLTSSALILFVAGRTYARKSFVILAGMIALIVLALTVPTGSRMLLLPFLGSAVVYHYVSRNARPGIVALCALLVISLFVSTLLVNARVADDGPGKGFRETATSMLHSPTQMLKPLTADSDAEMAPALAAALRLIPEDLDYQRGGATVGDLVTRPIPRQLWREKPLPPRERIISRLWPTEYWHRVANPEFSVLLFFYLDFALVGVIAGMAIYGVIARAVYEYFRLNADNLVARLLFSLSVPFIAIALRDSPVDTVVRAAFIFLPVLLVFRFAARRWPQSASR